MARRVLQEFQGRGAMPAAGAGEHDVCASYEHLRTGQCGRGGAQGVPVGSQQEGFHLLIMSLRLCSLLSFSYSCSLIRTSWINLVRFGSRRRRRRKRPPKARRPLRSSKTVSCGTDSVYTDRCDPLDAAVVSSVSRATGLLEDPTPKRRSGRGKP